LITYFSAVILEFGLNIVNTYSMWKSRSAVKLAMSIYCCQALTTDETQQQLVFQMAPDNATTVSDQTHLLPTQGPLALTCRPHIPHGETIYFYVIVMDSWHRLLQTNQ